VDQPGDRGLFEEDVEIGESKLIRQDKERRLATLEQSLLAAAKGRTIDVPLAEIRKKGLIKTLHKHAERR
jgi:hypothetical protein